MVLLLTLALAVVLVIPMALPTSAAPSGWNLLQTIIVDSNTNQVPVPGTPAFSQVLVSGDSYLIEVSGTYYANAGITADAKYSSGHTSYVWQDSIEQYEGFGPGLLELKVDGQFVDWGAYNPEHIYSIMYVGTGSVASFAIYDLGANNTGSLTVKIYGQVVTNKLPLLPATWNGVTSGSGFVVITSTVGSDFNLVLTVSLKGAAPDTTYEVWLENDGNPGLGCPPPVGTFTTNRQGNGNFHINMFITPGTYDFGIDVAIGGADQYVTPNVYGAPIMTIFYPIP